MERSKSVVIIGGGLAGLVASILLQREGFEVSVIEKKEYPFHRVCGEYISNEVLPFLSSFKLNVDDFNPSKISKLAVSSPSGKLFTSDLDLGGFGLSRYNFDNLFYKKAIAEGVSFNTGLKANSVLFNDNVFETELSDSKKLQSDFVIAAYGKRSNMDKSRDFFYRRSPYVGVKYHIRTDFPRNLIQLDNFEGGYCGTVKIEEDRYCLCYLSKNENLKNYDSIEAMEKSILFKNPYLKSVFAGSDFVFNRPEVINEICFEQKSLVENHILFCGDAAGMISPLCGNGMAMAIHSAKILAEAIVENHKNKRSVLESSYELKWRQYFAQRLQIGRLTQKLFGSKFISELAVSSLKNIKPLSNLIIRQTHGQPF